MTDPAVSASTRDLVVRAAEDLAHALLDEIGPELAAAAGHATVEMKADGTPVTSWDVAANDYLVNGIGETFPEHGILSEEGDTTWSGARWTWVIDPIDGTSNFITGIPYWAISLALAVDGAPVLAFVDAPALGERYVAVAGGGARLRRRGIETPLKVMSAVDFGDGRNAHTPIAASAGLLRRKPANVHLNARIMGAWALDLAMVAAGRFVGAVATRPKVWDVAAGALLVTEAGGAVDLSAEPLLPLAPGADYARRDARTIAGPSEDWIRRLAEALGQ